MTTSPHCSKDNLTTCKGYTLKGINNCNDVDYEKRNKREWQDNGGTLASQ